MGEEKEREISAELYSAVQNCTVLISSVYTTFQHTVLPHIIQYNLYVIVRCALQ